MKKIISILLITSFTILILTPYKVSAYVLPDPAYICADGTTVVIDDSIKTLLATPLVGSGMEYSTELGILSIGLNVYEHVNALTSLSKEEKDAFIKRTRERSRIKFQPWVYDVYNSVAKWVKDNVIIFGDTNTVNEYNLPDGFVAPVTDRQYIIRFANDNYYAHWSDDINATFYLNSDGNICCNANTLKYYCATWSTTYHQFVQEMSDIANWFVKKDQYVYSNRYIDNVMDAPIDYTNDIINLDTNFDYAAKFPVDSEIGLKAGVTANSLIGINTLDGVIDNTEPTPVDDTDTARDTNKTVTSIWDWLKAFPNTLLGILEKLFGKSTDINGQNISDIQGDLQSKFDCPRLKMSFDKLKMMNTSRGNPPKFYINLGKLSNASSKRFGFTGAFEDKETVFFDFATLNEYKFMGLPLPDWTYNIIGFGMLYLTAIYVWNKLHPREGLA